MRRRFRILRRSRSEVPPQTPWSIRFVRAYSRHGAVTGHVWQIRRAWSTPTPSLGKNTEGGWLRQLPRFIQALSVVASSISSPSSVRRRSVLRLLLVPDHSYGSGLHARRPPSQFGSRNAPKLPARSLSNQRRVAVPPLVRPGGDRRPGRLPLAASPASALLSALAMAPAHRGAAASSRERCE